MINCSGTIQRQGTIGTMNDNWGWIKRPQQEMLQDRSDEDIMHHNQNQPPLYLWTTSEMR